MTLSFLSTRQFLRRSCREYFLFCWTVLVITSNTLVVVEAAYDDPDYDEKKREKPSISELYQKMKTSKLWFLRDIHPSVPFSPLTALIVGLVTLQIYVNYGTYAYCEASHILLRGHQPDRKEQLLKWKKEIGDDYTKFAEYAKEHSACPSGIKDGGSLGRFYRGDMAKNFDRVSFDPKTPICTTVGPFQTSFGWHLIYIKNRDI